MDSHQTKYLVVTRDHGFLLVDPVRIEAFPERFIYHHTEEGKTWIEKIVVFQLASITTGTLPVFLERSTKNELKTINYIINSFLFENMQIETIWYCLQRDVWINDLVDRNRMYLDLLGRAQQSRIKRACDNFKKRIPNEKA